MRNTLLVFILFLLIGVLLTVFAFLGWHTPFFLFVTFFFILSHFVYCLSTLMLKLPLLSKLELVLVYFFIAIWALHFLQVLVPETGFDALWYHLPVAQGVLYAKGLVYLPQLYQSVNPQFADLYFLTGFSVLGILGAKLIAYIFASFLSIASYYLARIFVKRKFAIVIAILVSTFQVVTWQSASFYIDVAKAFFEIVGILLLFYAKTKRNSFFDKNVSSRISLLFFSASLATKLFSIVLVPVFIFSFGIKDFFSKSFHSNFLLLFLLPLLYYLFAFINTGNPVYSLFVHTQKLQEIGGEAHSILFILKKVILLPQSLLVFITAREYVNPILVLFFIPILIKQKIIWCDKNLRILLVFSLAQWIVWWFVPPLSTRYALSGFITLLILGTTIVLREFAKNQKTQNQLFISLLLCAVIAVLPRILVARRSLQYILTNQTRQEYLQQFYDGSIDEKIKNWYGF